MSEEAEHQTVVMTQIGVITRAVAWLVDAVLINLVAVVTGLGATLVTSVFPVPRGDQMTWQVVGGVVYALWCVAYFVVFWSITGQTPGARLMQISLVTTRGGRVKPVRALVRWLGMLLAALPLFAGYLPIVFGRRGFPDWVAKTLVVDAEQPSLAQVLISRGVEERRVAPAASRPMG